MAEKKDKPSYEDPSWGNEHDDAVVFEQDNEEEVQVKKPQLYNVLLHNDDYTTMEFVIMILTQVFRRNEEESVQIMLHVHEKGVGRAGTYTWEVAETKAAKVERMAREREYPLRCSIESA